MSAQRQENSIGNVFGFGQNFNCRFGPDIVTDQEKPINIDSFGAVKYAHAGYSSILITENGKLFDSRKMSELKYLVLDVNNRIWSFGDDFGVGLLGHGD